MHTAGLEDRRASAGWNTVQAIKMTPHERNNQSVPCSSNLRNYRIPQIGEPLRVNQTPSRAALIELEFISNPDVDTWFNSAGGTQNIEALAEAMADAILLDINIQP